MLYPHVDFEIKMPGDSLGSIMDYTAASFVPDPAGPGTQVLNY